ncbi:MAG: Ig-like domain-containing protein [Gemmatimonadota bacterium]|nr:Ig-like domain-containing protein [Gemmatimonadota bacterium]
MRSAWGAAAGALLVAAVSACARQGAPPGGEEDHRPPVVISTVPEPFAVVPAFDGKIVFRFDERTSERVSGGSMDDVVLVSPRSGAVKVHHGRRSLEVEVEGGIIPGQVYRVTLLPMVSDMFGNAMRDAFELVFSTGPELEPTAVAGQIWDRVQGGGVRDAIVVASSATDSVDYVARTDGEGIYAFRYLPLGVYRMVAYLDRNRNDSVDAMEVQGERALLVEASDTLLIDLAVLQPDTTSARLVAAEALDSATVELRFDDHLDPDRSLGGVAIRFTREDGGSTSGVVRTFHDHEYDAYLDAVRDSLARVDSIARAAAALAADTMDVDSLEAAPPVAPTRPRLPPRQVSPLSPRPGAGLARPGQQRGNLPAGAVLPGQRIVVHVGPPLESGVAYVVSVEGVMNINQLPNGGGLDTLIWEAPVRDTVVADTAAAGLDTAAVRDTLKLP